MKGSMPETTLFLIMSLDGKISTGSSDKRDVDKDFPKIDGVKEGLYQYYELEKKTDIYSLNTGRVMSKIGVNSRTNKPIKTLATFIIIDNKPHLNKKGVIYIAKWAQNLYLVTTNRKHPAFSLKIPNMKIIYYPKKLNLKRLFMELRKNYGVDKLTIQSGGNFNSELLRGGLINHISIVVAPALIGGKETSTLIDGKSLISEGDLKKIKSLKLIRCRTLKNNYLHLRYDVMNNFK